MTAYAVDLVAVPEQAIAGVRERCPVGALDQLVRRLRWAVSEAGLQPAGPVMARYFEEWREDGDVDCEVAVPVLPGPDGSVPDRIGEAHGDLIPAHHAFATVHHGPYAGLQAAFAALARELETLGYVAAGPATAVYIRSREDTTDPSGYVTVLRQPYAR